MLTIRLSGSRVALYAILILLMVSAGSTLAVSSHILCLHNKLIFDTEQLRSAFVIS